MEDISFCSPTLVDDCQPRFIAFMAVIPHADISYIVDVIQEYNTVTQYLISLEVTKTAHQDNSGEHMHFLTDMSDKEYTTFSDRVFRKRYHLRGQAKKGLSRQYGKLRDIHDLERMGAYTVKDGNIRTNLSDSIIARWASLSFKRDDEIDFREKLYLFLDESDIPSFLIGDDGVSLITNTFDYKEPTYLRLCVLKFYREDNKMKIPTSRTCHMYVTGYMMYHAKNKYTIEEVDRWVFCPSR